MLTMAVARSSSGGVTIGDALPVLRLTSCLHVISRNNNNNNNSHDNVYGAVIMTKVIARVHPVHLINVD